MEMEAYEAQLAQAEGTAVRWRWTADGRSLRRPPGLPWHAHVAIGADALGRTVWIREYDDAGEVVTDEFVTWGPAGVRTARWRAPSDLPGRPALPELRAERGPGSGGPVAIAA